MVVIIVLGISAGHRMKYKHSPNYFRGESGWSNGTDGGAYGNPKLGSIDASKTREHITASATPLPDQH